jgi:hypothetical protein
MSVGVRASQGGVFDRFLSLIARDPNEPPAGATAGYTVENCPNFAIKTIPSALAANACLISAAAMNGNPSR